MPETEWIQQTFFIGFADVGPNLPRQILQISLNPNNVLFETGSSGSETLHFSLHPQTRKEANQLSMALRKASRRLEEIGKELK